MPKVNLFETKFSELTSSFLVTFLKGPAGEGVEKGSQKGWPEKMPRKGAQKTTQMTAQKTTQKQKQILQYLLEHPEAGREQIAYHVKGITVDGVKHNLKSLQRKGLLRRVGPDKGGRWEVVKL